TIVRTWDAASGKLLRMYRGHEAGIRSHSARCIAFWPDAGCIVSSDARTTRLWDANADQAGITLPGYSLVFSPDGSLALTTGISNATHLWDLDTGLERQVFGGSIGRSVFSPDGRRLATAVSGGIRMLDPSRGTEIFHLRERDSVYDLVYDLAFT